MQETLADLMEQIRAGILDGPAETDAASRRAAAAGAGLSQPLEGYLDKVRRHAYRVTDEDVDELRRSGYAEEQIYELTVAAAYGAAAQRLAAGLEALR